MNTKIIGLFCFAIFSAVFSVMCLSIGEQGPRGEKGFVGDQGIRGEKGPTGDQGPRGDQGPIGPSHGTHFDNVSITTLRLYQPLCSDFQEHTLPFCLTACNRLCLNKGYNGGLMTEWSGQEASCGCF